MFALHHPLIGQAKQAAAQYAFADVIAAQQVAFHDLVGQLLVQAIINQASIQFFVFPAQLLRFESDVFDGIQWDAEALLGQRLNQLLLRKPDQRTAHG